MFKNKPKTCGSIYFSLLLISPLAMAASESLEEIVVWGDGLESDQAKYTNPTSLLTQEDLASINVVTTEDVVKYEPSLVIRRRFIGDSNGTLGIRSSNMFQTSRSMVFADGVPLHYLLQSRWNGAPRWTMVSASEIAQVEVIYGPFSAEYSGNAMGGVVSIETAIPQEREFHFDSSFYSQNFDAYGFDDSVSGYKTFFSYGDKIDDLSLYFSYNHLENDSQPQSFYYGGSSSSASPTLITGAIPNNDERGNPRLYFGDTGIVDTTTDNFKFKAGYDFGEWFALLNIAYEDRNSLANSPNSYVQDLAGNTVWSGDVSQDGQTFSIPASRLKVSELVRQSLSSSIRLRGQLSESVSLEANINQFEVLKDESRASGANPADPIFSSAGEVTDFGDTGWQTAEVKVTFADLGIEGLNLITGLRHENYELSIDVYNSDNFSRGTQDSFKSRSGGKTAIDAAFLQLNWDLSQAWNVALGGRYESWSSSDGYYDNDDSATTDFELEQVPGRSNDKFSPKFSLGFQPNDVWQFRYSLAKAYRFAIVEELFSQFEAFNAISVANPELKPENGLHHNLLLQRDFDQGYLRVNIFKDNIEDVIESQSTIVDGGTSVRTFIPIDEVETTGIEFIANLEGFINDKLDIRFNLAYTDSEIIKNLANPAYEGNVFPRMPEWRSNLLATYHIDEAWDIGANIQYASDSFGRIDNTDNEDNVYSAQDAYTRLGVKTTYRFNSGVSLGFGIDNLTDEVAYVAHPWPGRTFFLNIAYDY